LLVHKTFNVSIPRNHIPSGWSFQYGPAENDPEYGPGAATETERAVEEEDVGVWLHDQTAERLGGDEGFLSFTVIGYERVICTRVEYR
jgi:DNA-directed RNA polymerase I subunit RPA43